MPDNSKMPDIHLLVPRDLKEDIEKIANKEYPPKTWSSKARELLYSYVAMHRARGNVE